MRRMGILAVVAVFVFVGWALNFGKNALIIENVTLIDSADGSSDSGMAVVIKGNRIAAVGITEANL